jgi:general stress protein 26
MGGIRNQSQASPFTPHVPPAPVNEAGAARSRGPHGPEQEIMMAHDHTKHEGAKKLYDLIKDVKVAMMTTIESDGSLHSRPMWSHTIDESGDIWFYTRKRDPKVAELAKDAQVNLAYSDPNGQTYVSVSGKAEIVTDQAKVKELWSEGLRTWFPKGQDDPEIGLIRVHPQGGEYWDSPSHTIVQLYGYVKAQLTGTQPTELNDQKKVSLAG